MFPPQHWDKFHLKAWTWLRDELLQGYVQFDMGCDLAQYGNKVERIMGIQLQNLPSENNFENVLKPSQKSC